MLLNRGSLSSAAAALAVALPLATADLLTHKEAQSAKAAGPTYDYIVVGSGPGGGVTASNLAKAGHSVLLIEAGADESDELSTVLAALSYPPLARISWEFFVRHYEDDSEQMKNNLLMWRKPDGSYFAGNGGDAPEGAEMLGMYYPRGNTLGGSAVVNAMATWLPNDAEWDYIASITGDPSWSAENMREIFMKVENNHYLDEGTPGHGFDGFMDVKVSSSSYYTRSPGALDWFATVAEKLGQDPSDVLALLESDGNYLSPTRDADEGFSGLPMHVNEVNKRWTPRDLIKSVVGAEDGEGSKRYNLTLQLESLASRIIFAEAECDSRPQAVGVEFLEGAGVYKATHQYDPETSPEGVLRRAYARKEVIVSGGAFNSPQLLQLSGVGDREHLESLGIEVVAHLPGVGRNLMDNQELPVVGHGASNFTVAPNPDPQAAQCTYGAPGDPCLQLWYEGEGPYTSPSGNSEVFLFKSDHSPAGNRDILTFSPPGIFRGFYIRDPTQEFPLDPPETVGRSLVRMTSQNNAGYVLINSTDPRDVPLINFNHYSSGAESDVGALVDTVAFIRRAFAALPAPYGPVEAVEPPCPAGYGEDGYCSDPKQDEDWIRYQTFGHHPVGTCTIGADDDEMAVLDGEFRVRGVKGLRVVDASVFPKCPGAFPVLPTTMIAQKASEVILAGEEKRRKAKRSRKN